MIGLLFFGVLFGYIFLVKFAVNRIYKYTEEKIARNIALVIFILIPTWDIIIGYPIYKYLCWNNSGVHIYKTVDDVEGFYVGVHEKIPILLPYKGYKYIDYRERKSSKYYRDSWIDNNTSKDCVSYVGTWNYDYTQAFHHGRCIVKKEIPKSEVSRWEYIGDSQTKTMLYPVDMKVESTISIENRKNEKMLSEVVSVVWKGGWLYALLSSIPVGSNWKIRCPRIIDIKFNEFIYQTLKPKKEK